MSYHIEKLSGIELTGYFDKVGIYPEKTILEERVRKLLDNAAFVTARNEQGYLVGIIAYYMNQPPLCYLTHASTVAEYRRQGIATKMLERLEKETIMRGFSLLKLEVHKENAPALNTYLKFGFHISYESPNKNWYMEKNI